jgi:hypothetical protein
MHCSKDEGEKMDAPIALIHFIRDGRHAVKSAVGVPSEVANCTEKFLRTDLFTGKGHPWKTEEDILESLL